MVESINIKAIPGFIEHARMKGAKRISVYTTEPGSDWRFYEKHGFQKYSSFNDSFMTLLRNEEVRGIVYVPDIQ